MYQLVPTFILEKIDAEAHRGTLNGAAMFVDLSGFSTIADVLGKHGHHGSEVLAVVMQSIFKPLVHSIYSQGGFVVGYAGDSITAVFPKSDIRISSLRCVSAAVAIQKFFKDNPEFTTSFGNFSISAKIGLSLGTVIWEIFYSKDHRKASYCFRGDALDTSARAEARAKPGEIWLHDSLWQVIESQLKGENRDGYYKIVGFDALQSELPMPDFTTTVTRHMRLFFSQEILNLTQRGEFRPIVNVFIDLSTDIQYEGRLDTFMQIIFDLQERYGGLFLRPDFGDKGANLLIFWGAPVANENDIERALNFLLELKNKTNVLFSAGVSYQLAYAGFIGADQREDYTSYGWGISLSARMMKSANKGEIWVDGEVARREAQNFIFSEPEAREFKGFATKQNVYALLGSKETGEHVFYGIFKGRQGELEKLEKFLAPIWESRFAGSFLVSGDAGVGKSRLVYEFKNSEYFVDKDAQWIFCQTDEIVRQSLNPFRYWLHRHFALDNNLSAEKNRSRFFNHIQDLADVVPYDDLRTELLRTRSFLAALINIHWDDSLYSQFEAKERYENTFIALSVLLRCESLRKPLIIQIDDAHWFDDDTFDFLPYFIRTLTSDENRSFPIAILATTRPEGESLRSVEGYPVQELALGGLGADSLNQLASLILGGPVSMELVDFLEHRADGNPFYVEQVLRYLRENELLRQRDGAFEVVEESQVDLLSTDIQSILIARLDLLTREVKEVVQSAAVLGREFEIRLLSEMLHDEKLPELVDQAEAAEVWVPLNEIRYIFRHALMRDAAYSMQLRSRQRQMHALALEAMEQLYASVLDQYYDELAYHAERAYNVEKAGYYLELAGHAARERFQNVLALEYYRNALKYIPEDDYIKRYEVVLGRERILSHWDQRDEQKQALDDLERLAERIGDQEKLLEARLRRANYLGFIGDYHLAEELASDSIKIADRLGRIELVCRAYLLLCDAIFHQGRTKEAIERGHEGIEISRQHNFPEREAVLLNMLGMVFLETEPASAHLYFEQAQEIFQLNGDINKLLMPTNNLGNLSGVRGDFSAAQEYYEQALEMAREVGNRKAESILLNNLGWIAGLMGDYRRARALGERNLRISREVAERYTETYTLINLSAYTGALGENESAVKYAEQALDLARQSGEVSGEAWGLTYLGHALFDLKQFQRAYTAYRDAIRIRQDLDQDILETEPAAGFTRAALVLNEKAWAIETLERVLACIQKDSSLEGTDQPIRVYLNSYLALSALGDARANGIIDQGCEMLKARAARITDPAARKMFLEEVSFHRELVQAKKKATSS